MEAKSIANVSIECSNPYSIPVFSDFINEIQKRFDVEKNAKDKAYAFIMQMGLMKQFADFSRHYSGIDFHKACIDMAGTEL